MEDYWIKFNTEVLFINQFKENAFFKMINLKVEI